MRPFLRNATRRLTSPIGLAMLIACVMFVYGVISLPQYGVTFDSPSLFYAGDRTLFWLQHREVEHALDLDKFGEPEGFVPAFRKSPGADDPVHYPVFPGLLCAITSRIFHDRLHWVNIVDGHHLGLVLLHCVGLLFYCFYVSKLLGRVAAVASTLMLALFPCALASSFNNAKDWPCALYYGVAILATAVGLIQGRARTLLVAGVLLGVSFACKLQALFALPTIMLWAPIPYVLIYWRRRRLPGSVAAAFFAMPYVAGIVFLASWPWLYHGKVAEWWDHLAEYLRFMVHYGVTEREWWTGYPFRTLLYMTPPIVLVLAAGYVVFGWRAEGHQSTRERIVIWTLLAIWFGVPMLRTAAPRSNFYGSNRHYFEYIPALCAMAGGFVALAWAVFERAVDRWKPPALASHLVVAAATAALATCLVVPIVRYRPYEITYFNSLVDGLGGAQANAVLFVARPAGRASGAESDYWFSTAREAMQRARTYMPATGGRIGFCGPWDAQVRANEPDTTLDIRTGDATQMRDVPIVYVAPEGNVEACTYWMARDFERERPILWRVERDHGLIYEVLGARDGKTHAVTTPLNAYDKLLAP